MSIKFRLAYLKILSGAEEVSDYCYHIIIIIIIIIIFIFIIIIIIIIIISVIINTNIVYFVSKMIP